MFLHSNQSSIDWFDCDTSANRRRQSLTLWEFDKSFSRRYKRYLNAVIIKALFFYFQTICKLHVNLSFALLNEIQNLSWASILLYKWAYQVSLALAFIITSIHYLMVKAKSFSLNRFHKTNVVELINPVYGRRFSDSVDEYSEWGSAVRLAKNNHTQADICTSNIQALDNHGHKATWKYRLRIPSISTPAPRATILDR